MFCILVLFEPEKSGIIKKENRIKNGPLVATECVAERCVPSVSTALNHNIKLTVVLLFTLATYFGILQCHDKVKIVEAHIASYAMMFFISFFLIFIRGIARPALISVIAWAPESV